MEIITLLDTSKKTINKINSQNYGCKAITDTCIENRAKLNEIILILADAGLIRIEPK